MLSLSSILLLTASAVLAVPSHDIHNLKRHQDLVKRKTYTANQVTWYPTDTGPDACTGKNHKDSDPYVALNVADWNNGKNCGRKIRITSNGITQTGTIVDKCATCPHSGEIDLTKDLFTSFGYSLGKGVFKASWVYADEEEEEPKPTTKKPTSTPSPTKTPTSTKEPTSTPTSTKKPDTPSPTTKKPDTPSPTPTPDPEEENEDDEDDEDCEYGYEDDEEEEETPAPPEVKTPKPTTPKPEAAKPAAAKPEEPEPEKPKADDTPKTTPTTSSTPASTPPAVVVATTLAAAGLLPSESAPAIVNPAAAPSESVGTDSIQGGIAGDSTFGNGAMSVGYSKAIPAILTLVFLALQAL